MFIQSGSYYSSICSVAYLSKIFLRSNLGQQRSGFKAVPLLSYSVTAPLSQKEYYDRMINRPHNHRPNSSKFSGASARRGGQAGRRGRDGHKFQHHNDHLNNTTHPRVPGMQLVVPGAAVSMVLKEDQPTGRQVQGIIRDVITRGDHPRGIKVRLSDGRIGRVQQMISVVGAFEECHLQEDITTEASSVPGMLLNTTSRTQPDTVARDLSHSPSTLPTRTLADYMLQLHVDDETAQQNAAKEVTSATAICPVCPFEGDEAAVSHHVGSHSR